MRGGQSSVLGAFREIHRRHAHRVAAQLTRLVGSGPEREDLSQQVFLDVYRALPSFRGDAAFTTFLYRLVSNVACDHLRARGRQRPPSISGADGIADPTASPERRTRDRQELSRLFALVGRLSPKKREALLLVTVDELSYEAAAARVGANAQAVKQRVLAARRELKAMLAASM
jgi:RNA polymerase sigma-70 factor (ECF subfamily)